MQELPPPSLDATEDVQAHRPVGLPLVFGAICFALAYFQPFGTSPDYQEYDSFLTLLQDSGLGLLTFTRFEPGFVALCHALILIIPSNLVVYSILAAASATTKMAIVRTFAPERFAFLLAALFYATRYMPLHELTQLRIALAMALLLLAFILRERGSKLGSAVSCAASLLFHFSAAFIIPFVFFKVSRRRHLVAIAVTEFILIRFLLPALVQWFTGRLEVLEMYEGQQLEVSLNVLALPVLLDLAVVLVSLIAWESLPGSMRQVILFEVAGIVFYYAAIDFPAFGHRVREAFAVFWLIFVAQGLVERGRVRVLALAFAVICIVLYSYLFFIRSDVPFFS